MKLKVIFDAAGNIIGAVQPTTQKGDVQSGLGADHGQMIHDIEVPDGITKFEGSELFKKLLETDSVKQTLSTLVTSGQVG